MDTNKIDDQDATVRVDQDDATVRVDQDDATVRVDQGDATADVPAVAAKKMAGSIFAAGQTLTLNNRNCAIESVISDSSGEAIVYKVKIDGKPYVLKHYKANAPLSDTARKALTRIKDKPKDRVVRIFDFGNYNGQDFEIMEFAEGGTLNQYISKNGPLRNVTVFKSIVKQITEGLEQLHGHYKIIYQDLKPDNIYFRDANKTSLILADFGISSVMEGMEDEVEVKANITDLYAAPELASKGKRTQVLVTPAVDYYALGITMMELWLGEKPFKGMPATKRDYLILEEKVDFPLDMPDDFKTIIQGLIMPQRKDRWGNSHIHKWLKGEALTLDAHKPTIAKTEYESLKITETEFATNTKELATLMAKYPDKGKIILYNGIIKNWLEKAGDVVLLGEIENIISQYKDDKDAGSYVAIYTLDPERKFTSRGGKTCNAPEEIADALMAESAYYIEELKKTNANLYLFLGTTEGAEGRYVAEECCKYFAKFSPKRALNMVYLKLQGDGGITLGSQRYHSTEEIVQEQNDSQIALIKQAVAEKDSLLLVWLSERYGEYFSSTEAFQKSQPWDKLFLVGKLPYLSYKELSGSIWEQAALSDLKILINDAPGRSDLFEVFAAQGLPLKGEFTVKGSPSPIDYIVRYFKNLESNHSTETLFNLISHLLKLGADINATSGDGATPVHSAVRSKNIDMINFLLGNNADGFPLREALEDYEQGGSLEIIKLLLEKGKKDQGQLNDALIAAVKIKDAELAKLLLIYGADRSYADNGKTAYQYALEAGNQHAFDFLKASFAAGFKIKLTSGWYFKQFGRKFSAFIVWLIDKLSDLWEWLIDDDYGERCIRLVAILFAVASGAGVAYYVWNTFYLIPLPFLAGASVLFYILWRFKRYFLIAISLALAAPGYLAFIESGFALPEMFGGKSKPVAVSAPVIKGEVADWARGTYPGNIYVGTSSITMGKHSITGVRTLAQPPLAGHPKLKWAYVYVGSEKYGVVWDKATYSKSRLKGVEIALGDRAKSALDFYAGSPYLFVDVAKKAPSIKVVKP